MSTEYLAQPVVHRVGCPDAARDAVLRDSRDVARTHPYARPHGCFSPWQAPASVVVDVSYPEHTYDPCMTWPGDAPRPLCRVCRGTHAGEHHWLYPATRR